MISLIQMYVLLLQLVFIINEDLNLRGLISLIFHFIKTCHA